MTYCGIGPIPKNKIRGTIEECLNAKQVRYWGIEKIPKNVIDAQKKDKKTLQAEMLKMKSLEGKAKKLIDDVKKYKLILDTKTKQKKKISNIDQKKGNKLLNKRDLLIKQIKRQGKLIERLKEQEKKFEFKYMKKQAPNIVALFKKIREKENKQRTAFYNTLIDLSMSGIRGPILKYWGRN